jgi:Carboxypeptidase regulatory-like domain
MFRNLTVLAAIVALSAAAGIARQPPAQGQELGANQRPARDLAQQQPQGTALIEGRVLAGDTGRPLKRARVSITTVTTVAAGGRQARATTTDDQGRFRLTDLVAGAYTITGSKNGFVDSVYGQRRPLQPGTPVQLADGQVIAAIELRLTRGSVITGHISDEDGEPVPRALVTVQRYQYVRGERQLTPAGSDQTDDRGQYRIFGLPPGDYYVSANATGLAQVLGRGLQQLAALATGAGGAAGRGGRGGFFGGALVPDDPEPSGYAPTYYPGVISAGDATTLTVAPGQELGAIDFQIQVVPLATVRGFVMGSDRPVPVVLVPQDSAGILRGQTFRAGSQADGTFAIPNVPPGHYTAVARSGGRGDVPKTGMLSINVMGENLANVTLVLQPGVSMSGNFTVESTGTPAPTDYSAFRIDAPEADPLPSFGPGPGGGPNGSGARAEKNGAFQVDNLLPGHHYIRATGQGVWSLKSVSIAGRDVTDQPIELRSGQNVDNVTIVMTDRSTEINGSVSDATGKPQVGLTVIAFSTDPQYWRAQSRRIQAVRTDQSGTFKLHGLPPGDYHLLAVDDAEQGEWFDPSYLEHIRPGAKRVSLSEGEAKTENLSAPQ